MTEKMQNNGGSHHGSGVSILKIGNLLDIKAPSWMTVGSADPPDKKEESTSPKGTEAKLEGEGDATVDGKEQGKEVDEEKQAEKQEVDEEGIAVKDIQNSSQNGSEGDESGDRTVVPAAEGEEEEEEEEEMVSICIFVLKINRNNSPYTKRFCHNWKQNCSSGRRKI